MPWRPLVTYEMMAQFKIETKLVFKKPLFFFNQADYGNDRSKYLRVQPSTALAILEKLKEAEKKNLVRTIFFDLFPRFLVEANLTERYLVDNACICLLYTSDAADE